MKKTREFRRHLRENDEKHPHKKSTTHFFVFKDEEQGKGRREQTDDDGVTMIMRSGSKTE